MSFFVNFLGRVIGVFKKAMGIGISFLVNFLGEGYRSF